MSQSEHWRARLRAAIDRTGKKHSVIAWEAGIAPETLSRILKGHHPRIGFDVVVRVTHAAGETVGWLLAEDGFTFSAPERETVLSAAAIMLRQIGKSE